MLNILGNSIVQRLAMHGLVYFSTSPIAILLCLAALASSAQKPSGPADFYVAAEGNDTWSGTLSTANVQRTDGPFATFERARDNVIEFNHIPLLGTGFLGTHGAIYALGTSPGTIIRNNFIHHISSSGDWGAGEGITLDNGCYGIVVENNVAHDAAAGGYGSNFNCCGNFIHNNIFARNIIVWREGPLLKEADWPALKLGFKPIGLSTIGPRL